jgi:hypothetical protein
MSLDTSEARSLTATTMEPFETEVLHPQRPTNNNNNNRNIPHFIDRLWMLLKLYMEYYPKLTALFLFSTMTIAIYYSTRRPVTRNRLHHDYTAIAQNYNFKASQMDHWCLFGSDDACACDDFNDPISHEELHGWLQAHEANKALIQTKIEYDVVFLGDETTEIWNGRFANLPVVQNPNGKKIQQYFKQTFTKAAGGAFDGLALGIQDDTVCN